MIRTISTACGLALALIGVTGTAVAHHPPRYERCQLYTFTGQLERIDWGNPHVMLVIREDDGTDEQIGWLNVQALTRAGIGPDTLHVGDRLEVKGGVRTKDVDKEPILVSDIRRLSDNWEWSQPLQGC